MQSVCSAVQGVCVKKVCRAYAAKERGESRGKRGQSQ